MVRMPRAKLFAPEEFSRVMESTSWAALADSRLKGKTAEEST